MNTPLRAGLIGLGMMGRHHARILSQLPGVQLVAAADSSGDPHHAAANIPVVANVEQLLAHRLDYCVVAVPTADHAQIGFALAAAGIPALIEKPLAPDLATARALAVAFDAAGLIAAVGHTERYNPALRALRARLADGALGTLYQISTRRQGPYPPRVRDVGVVFDLATHDLDVTTWVTGMPLVSLAARTVARSGRIAEDLVVILGELSDGTVTSHLVNWLSPLKERVTTATGANGCLAADTVHGDLTFYANGSAKTEWAAAEVFRGVTEGDITRYAIPKREPLLGEHEAFRDAILGKDAPIVTLWQAAATIAAAEAVLTSATTGGTAAPEQPRIPRPRLASDYALATTDPSSR
ncbi:Predicted dehydrogenase [Asanoa hainanensis]|uniref:Predicted dehydrogenase n=1 Tax=Asanoa hainanensis TaxID=560556 RepID=A0A239NRM2_9ACTN|nr:Gfo/Idh/MocA family oxidoreductase [Asanoa hainanensis]SNT57537.1 Predicted dehydrogenase [Asanoa hainanensis]